MEKFFKDPVDLRTLSPLTLAFVGDAVFTLIVREQLAVSANRPAGALHRMSVQRVNAAAQAKSFMSIAEHLTEEEEGVFKRGRNAHTSRTPKAATTADYHTATGMEALFGYLYLQGKIDRIRELIYLIKTAGEGNTTDE